MKRIKKLVLAVITAFVCCISSPAAVYAEEISVADELDIDVGSISENLPSDVGEILNEKDKYKVYKDILEKMINTNETEEIEKIIHGKAE